MIFKKLKELTGHSSGIYSLAFDGVFLYSASADRFVTRWNIEEGIQDKFSIRFNEAAYSICLINEKKQIVVGLANGDLHIFDLENRIEIKYFTQHKNSVFSITENSHKNHFYTADSDGNLAIWNSLTFELLLFLPLNCGKIRRINCSSNGDHIVLSGQDGLVRVFDTETYNEVSTFFAHESGATCILFNSLDQDVIFSGGKDALLKIWNWKTNELLKEIPAHNYVIYDMISINSGSNFVTCSRDKTVKIWSTSDYSFIDRLDLKKGGHRHSVNCLQLLDEGVFASASDDKRIILWNKKES